jgi:hypothetical protein
VFPIPSHTYLEFNMNTKAAVLSAKPFIWIAALTACVILSGAVQAADEGFVCTNATLKGNYGFTVTGMRPATHGGPQVSIVGTALTRFHGDGTFDQFDNINVDSPAVPFQADRPGSGIYNLNPDCSGSMTLTAGGVTLELSITVVDQGREVRTAVVTPNVIVTSNGRRT